MPDDIIISELSNAPQIDDSAVFPFTQDNAGSPATFKASMSEIAGKIAEGTTFVNLETTAKNLIGAINEVAQGGGSTDIISEASGTIATFNDGGDNIPVKSLVTEITATQAGTGTPAPDNVRAITGFDAVDVVVCGKNIFSSSIVQGALYTSGTETSTSTTRVKTADYIVCKPNTQYAVSFNSGVIPVSAVYYDKNKVYISGDNLSAATFTTPLNCAYVRFGIAKTNTTQSITPSDVTQSQLEEGSTTTTYEPYVSTNHTITLPETIYGGTAEFVGGNGVKDYGYIEFDGSSDEDWSFASGNKWATITISDMMSGANQNGITNWLPKSTSYGTFGFALGRNNNNFYAYQIPDISGVTDLASWKTYLSNNPLQVVYPLATPTAFTFTGANIPTLSGENNIYSNTGDVEVEYFNENADQTSELIDAKQEFVNYSSDEKVVGKWLDGSPLYEKTLYFNNVKLDKTDSTSELVHGVDNIGTTRFVAEVYFKFPNSGQDSWSPANNGLWNNGVYNFYWCVGETSIFILSASGVYFDANPNRSYLVKIRYTKA